MGVVYRVFDAEMHRDVALKTLPDLVPSEVVVLKEEFRALAGITHDNLIELYELFVDGDEDAGSAPGPRPPAFFTMELLNGHNIVEHVRGHPRRSQEYAQAAREGWLDRLVEVLPQLAAAVSALHRAGKLHRDIKPSNVWVDAGGRLVLLDFGLAIPIAGAGARGDARGGAAGTLAYMAPEQISSSRLSPATDWYAVGEVLYEALTGERPFGGSKTEIIDAKAELRVPRPRERAVGVPPVLDALVMALLHPDGPTRASGEDVTRTLRTLGIAADDDSDDATTAARAASFVGRVDELSALRAAFEQSGAGAPLLVRVEGTSGIGKTELLRRFTGELEAEHGALVLRGRCHEQESVPYKAFDVLVDGLSAALAALPRERAARLVPRDSGALLRIFPVLGAVAALADVRGVDQVIEPQERRRRGFEALGELLANMARDRPTALWIDDLQWGDADSVLLLRELLGTAGPVLFVVCYRSEDLERSPILADLDRALAALPAMSSRRIRLTPLGDESSRALAASVLGRSTDPSEGLVAAIAAEADGSPFFIAELARHAARSMGAPPAAGSRDEGRLARVIHDRLERLRPAERRLLEIVSTAGGPVDRSLALAAAGLGERGRPDVARLGHACLLRTAQVGDRATVETYHDRIREALVGALPAERRRECHRDLASALRALPDPDPEALFHHYRGAGEDREAALFVVAAADRAAAALAFDRAAELYQHALDLRAPDRTRLLESLAECLVNAGRGADAPPCFLAAANGRAGDPTAVLALKRQAAEQLIRTGRVEEGTAIFRRVLADVGVRMPGSSVEASLRSATGLLRLAIRGFDHRPRRAGDLPVALVQRLDALWGANVSLSMMNPPVAAALAIQHLLETLDAGEPTRLVNALIYEIVLESAIGGRLLRRRASRMLALVEELAAELHDPLLRGSQHAAQGQVAWHEGRFPDAARSCDEALRIFAECRGTAWHRVAVENYALSTLAFLGDMMALKDRRRAARKRAEDQGDHFASAICRIGQLSMDTIADDHPERAVADADSVTASWPLRLYHHTIITVQAELYRGDPAASLARIERAWPSLQKDGLLLLEFPRIELLHLRARAALGVAARGGLESRQLTRRAASWAKRIAASALPPAAPFTAAIRAGIARIEGDHTRAAVASLEAVRGFEAAGMALYAGAHRMALGDEGAQERMAALGVQRPDRIARMLRP
jgi:hypothetical protein